MTCSFKEVDGRRPDFRETGLSGKKVEVLKIHGIGDKIGLNPAVVKKPDGQITLLARIEDPDSKYGTTHFNPSVVLLEPYQDGLRRIPGTPEVAMREDPAVTPLGDKYLVSTVDHGNYHRSFPRLGEIRTRFDLVNRLEDMNTGQVPVAEVPGRDYRAVQLPDGKIGFFTRPALTDGIGRIGFTIMQSIDVLRDPKTFTKTLGQADSQLLPFANHLKMGSNEAQAAIVTVAGPDGVQSDKVVVRLYCHTARVEGSDYNKDPIHYTGYQTFFEPFDPELFDPKKPLLLEEILNSSMCKNARSKEPAKEDVVYPAGNGGIEETTFYSGAKDAEIARVQDPGLSFKASYQRNLTAQGKPERVISIKEINC